MVHVCSQLESKNPLKEREYQCYESKEVDLWNYNGLVYLRIPFQLVGFQFKSRRS